MIRRATLALLAGAALAAPLCAQAQKPTVSYGPNRAEHYRQSAAYVDRILKGAKPADQPVQQPTRFELVVNLKTAKSLGIVIPPAILVQATQVIE